MPLARKMTCQQAVNYLRGDLLGYLRNDVDPVIEAPKSCFGPVLLMFCLVDHLGALRYGWDLTNPRERKYGPATSKKAKDFIKCQMSEVDRRYQTNGPLAYELYRHGLTHGYAPRSRVRYENDLVSWQIITAKDQSRRRLQGRIAQQSVTLVHMEKTRIPNTTNEYVLPIFTNAIRVDLEQAIYRFAAELEKESTRNDDKGWLLKTLNSAADGFLQVREIRGSSS